MLDVQITTLLFSAAGVTQAPATSGFGIVPGQRMGMNLKNRRTFTLFTTT